ncbi:hypothetical protein MXL46_13980 [Heyndrickxia sporothermodurans]|uniref:Uncharacterized protein n=3 Tax=Heyndrickxia sporothermodurans TaxID=46224 RepID=A0AB37HKB8_9BACI|nr:hypothetical protein [Heyndrickxia sporothermodurans]MBL5783484.1 hypothetical protein [Heyndrickxia sporothermodurans]MBL5804036.1 hypothetical protein [Heyndrickxia sporothermodurans]MBL5867948.1 hypothetical protein [Heyndrickxia sporothermodurans]MBL7247527.1 hypothetical protein [Heyndrickxia sporothermodurans]MEB6550200.1 hypothetical protein [Heyndrickxia sporothermodurans]
MDNKNKNHENNEIQKIKKQIERLDHQATEIRRSLKSKTKYEYRKQRTRRLVETGALVEKYFKLENLSISEREELFKMFATFVNANKPNHLKK